MTREFSSNPLPALGNRSQVKKAYEAGLKRAFFSTHSLVFFSILLIFSYVKYQQWRADQLLNSGKRPKPPIVIIDPARIGPPPSIIGPDGDGGNGGTNTGVKPTAPAVGSPKAVPDSIAVLSTMPDQHDVVGTGLFDGQNGGIGDNVVIQIKDIPPIDTFIPFEIPPQIVAKPRLDYPEIPRALGIEGTVYIKALVDVDGSIMRVAVVRSSGSAVLDSAAAENVGSWTMKPAFQNDKPVRVWVGTPVTFRLDK
jgi:TonB family protein